MSKETFSPKEVEREVVQPEIESKTKDISMEEPLKTEFPTTILPDNFKKELESEKFYEKPPLKPTKKDIEHSPNPDLSDFDTENRKTIVPVRGIKKLIGTAGILLGGFFAAKAAPTAPETTLKNTDSTEAIQKKSPEVVVDHKIEVMKIANEIKEKSPNIVKVTPLEQSDETKEVFAIALNSYKNYNDIFDAMEAAGLTRSSEQTMITTLKNNPTMLNKGFAFMATKEEVNKLGKPSYATMTTKRGGGELFINARETSVDINSDLDGYMFIVEKKVEKKNTTANYTDYAKN